MVNCIVAWYLKREDRELWVQRDKVEYTRDVSDWSIDGGHTRQGGMRYSRKSERKTISGLIQRQEGSIGWVGGWREVHMGLLKACGMLHSSVRDQPNWSSSARS